MRRLRYYSRDGKPLTLMEWVNYSKQNKDRKMAESTLPGGVWVSTVWLGLDHNILKSGPPKIFESMVFRSRKDLHEFDCVRYSTKQQALMGHALIMKKWSHWWRDEDKLELMKK